MADALANLLPHGRNAAIEVRDRPVLAKATDLSIYSQEQRDAIADEINGRPRKGLGERSPLAVYRELFINNPRVALHF